MKFDKETIIKHRFWFLLGTVLPLLLIMLCVLKFGVADTVDARKKEYDSAVASVKGISNPKNDSFIQPVKAKEDTLNKKKSKVWEEAWKGQGNFITWPQEMQRELGDKYYGDFISEEDRRKYARVYMAGYVGKIEKEFTDLIAPVEFKGGFNSIIRTVPAWDENKPPLLEEMYLAQEDISVQRELLNIIRSTLDALKKFVPVEQPKGDKKPQLPSGVVAQYVFKNPNWEMKLSLELNDKKQLIISGARSSIKNINASKRTMALDKAQFQVTQGQAGAVLFRIPAEYVLWNQEVPLRNDVSIDKFNKNSPIALEQVFDWNTSPIKRIDALVMSYNSQRLANYALKMRKIDDTLQVSAGSAGSTGGGKGFGLAGVTMPPTMSGPPPTTTSGTAPAGGDAAANLPDQTPNNLSRYRYLDVRDQVRWMPIGMVLVIDQSAMQDVLSAIANSKLRIQTTQVTWSHVGNVRSEKREASGGSPLATPSTGKKGAGEEVAGGAKGPSAPGLPGTAPGIPGAPPGLPNFGGSGMIDTRRFSGNQEDPNLIELSVYGIASLYERYPPKAASAGSSTTTGSTPAPSPEPPKGPAGK
jgi:hypothetical protein